MTASLLTLACAFITALWAIDAAGRDAASYRATYWQRRAWAKERRRAGWVK